MLMIPNSMLQSLIRERQYRKSSVITEIASSWGNQQTVAGPVLSIPYEYETVNSDGTIISNQSMVYVLPEILDINSVVTPAPRNRSIYTALLYKTSIDAKGNFQIPDLSKEITENNPHIKWHKASISIGISDVQAMDNAIQLKLDGKQIEMEPGTASSHVLPKGVQAKFALMESTENLSFSYTVSLKGNESLFFEPIGKNTTVKMKSSWPSPSFIGKILPENREISKDGFTANWKANKYNRDYPQVWTSNKYRIAMNNNYNNTNYRNNYAIKDNSIGNSANSFGVRLVEPVDFYLKNTRAAKYAILIIGLSFGIFFFFEMLKKNKIHVIQYIMVGFALTLFYFLLLSITEHIGFDIAYLISSIATIGLITIYAANILKYGKSILVLFVALTFLYGYIFVILQLEDYALLAGSIGLFVILAITMYFSRNVNWYAIQEENV